MTLLHVIVIAIVQGITEFLPISSSGHLVLIPALTCWPDQGLLVYVAAHVGTLGAVIVYFRSDAAVLIRGALRAAMLRPDQGSRLVLLLVIATVPAIVAGAAVGAFGSEFFRDVEVIAWTMTIGAFLLYGADRVGMKVNRIEHMRLGQAVVIGLVQALALIPGTSRAGITMTAARFFGFERREAARFSMLLSIPVIMGAGVLAGTKLVAQGESLISGDALVVALLSFLTALASIAVLMRWLRDASFTPLVIYRLALGAGLLWWVYGAGGVGCAG